MDQIRALPGFENFLLPKTFNALKSSLDLLSGPVVFINTHSTCCDALLLYPGGTLTSVSLPDFSTEKSRELLSLWLSQFDSRIPEQHGLPLAHHTPEDIVPIEHVLEQLWTCVVCPVLEALDTDAHVCQSNLRSRANR